MTSLKKIGFVGTGIMGAAMAGHLLDAGFELSVYNRTKSKAQALIDRGARWCDTVGECAAGQDVVISIVGYPKDVEQIYLGAGGIVDSAKSGAYLVDMTTSSPILAEKIFAAAQAKGLHAVDAPVTGGDVGAKKVLSTRFNPSLRQWAKISFTKARRVPVKKPKLATRSPLRELWRACVRLLLTRRLPVSTLKKFTRQSRRARRVPSK